MPTIRTSTDVLLRAGGAALLVGVLATILWYLFPEWKFYLSLLLGFGVAEAIAYVAKGKRGTDLQILGIVVVTLVVIAVRVTLAQKYGFSFEQLSSSQVYRMIDDNRLVDGTPREFMQMTLIPDLLFAAMAYAIVWIRFR